MHSYRVLVIGGSGFFGRRLVERLARQPGLDIVIAGRNVTAASSLAERFPEVSGPKASLSVIALDARDIDLAQRLAALSPRVIVNATGPFQGQDYRIAQASVAAGAHYLDLADSREFVAGIVALDPAARRAGVRVLSGASSVPALSSAAADRLAVGLARVERIDIGISPGNRTERGLATVRAILSYCGRALPDAGPRAGLGARPDEVPAVEYGWSGTRRHRYPDPVGSRLLSPCDVPDLTLLGSRYPGAPVVRFGAGLELEFLHRGMNAMARLARAGLVRDWSVHARGLKWVADRFTHWGSDAGAMHVSVAGELADGTSRTRTWHLVALRGDGPFVPTLAASALVRQLHAGRAGPAGAGPCIGQLTLADFEAEAQGLAIRMAEDSP